MEEKSYLGSFVGGTRRPIEAIKDGELALAAKWWARNTVVMSVADPWKPHVGLIALAALIAADARELESWLRHANQAVGNPNTSIYTAARDELLSAHPPWLPNSSGMLDARVHDESWSRALRTDELARLLGEIANDGTVRMTASKLVVL